jgi:hypothetical protein
MDEIDDATKSMKHNLSINQNTIKLDFLNTVTIDARWMKNALVGDQKDLG